MDKLAQLKDALWSYVSPRKPVKKQQRPRRPQQVKKQTGSTTNEMGRRSMSMSPTQKTYQWLQRPVKDSGSSGNPSRAAKKHERTKVREGRVTKPALPTPTPSRRSNGVGHNLKPTSQSNFGFVPGENGTGEEDFGNDETLVEDDSLIEQEVSSEEADMNEDTLVEDGVEQESVAPVQHIDQPANSDELRRQREAMVNAAAVGWTADEDKLYRVITMRGFEPIFPTHWRMDFQALPNALFCYPKEIPFFNSASDNDFHATTALYKLLALGYRVREQVRMKKPPEALIKREIEAYIAWSEKDGGYAKKPHIPLISIATPRDRAAARDPNATHHLEAQIRRKLTLLASRYRSAFTVHKSIEPQNSNKNPSRECDISSVRSSTPINNEFSYQPPTLYGMLILHSVVAIGTYNSANLESPLRTVAILDLGKKGQEVWNGIAIAAAVICARDWLTRLEPLKAEKEISESSDDPDA
ncbi:MAG: hypothetical protein M1837_007043 [Sclerophora amabilis]|nr:MAG: hypothetical protein M1837_007043 [Sclerophora amabilis]